MGPWLKNLGRMMLGAVLLGGCAGVSPHETPGGPRSIVLTAPELRETVSATYWHDGHYDSKSMRDISALFRDRRNGQQCEVDPRLIDLLHDLREEMDLKPETPIVLVSGYRSPVTNASLRRTNANVAEHSFHIQGQAADIRIAGIDARRIDQAAATLGRGGHAWYPSSGHVHVDVGPPRTWTPR